MIGFSTAARTSLASVALALALATSAQADGKRDELFVGDGIDDKVEVFDAATGAFRRSLAPTGLLGPRGIVFRSGRLFLVNQNVNTDFTGEVLRFNAGTGSPVRRLIPADTPDAPFAPRGMVLWDGHLFVANVLDVGPEGPLPGGVKKYTAAGDFVETLSRSGSPDFRPFGVVIGPDRLLYVSSRPNILTDDRGGQVLRFDPATGDFVDTFVSNGDGADGGCTDLLTGPEGLVFGPDGRLYVTSFRKDATDTDKILIFGGPGSADPGACVGRINLDRVGGPRSTAQTLLFGPGGRLFVPISNIEVDGVDTGAIRRYRIGCTPTANRRCYTNFVRPRPVVQARPGLVPDLRQDEAGNADLRWLGDTETAEDWRDRPRLCCDRSDPPSVSPCQTSENSSVDR